MFTKLRDLWSNCGDLWDCMQLCTPMMVQCICASDSESKAVVAQDLVVSDLTRTGFVLNVSKSHLEPVQIIDWLGFTVDRLF